MMNHEKQGIVTLIKASNPLIILILIWIITITSYSFGISYNIQNNTGLLAVIALLSLVCFTAAFYVSYRYAPMKSAALDMSESCDKLSTNKLRLFCIFAVLACMGIVVWNLYNSGCFPYMAVWGYKVTDYKSYGRFKGILFPLMFLLFMVSTLEKRKIYEWIIKLFCLSVGWLYVSRAALAIMISQYIIFIIVTGKYKTIVRFMIIIIIAICFMIFTIGYLGKVRTGDDNFKRAMQIKKEYSQVPTTALWFISYLSMPSVNLLQIVECSDRSLWGEMLLNSSLPVPLKTAGWDDYYKSLLPNRYNTACTYLGYAFLDFSWYGIAMVNIIYGLLGGFLFRRVKKTASLLELLCYSVYLPSLGLIFFSNMIFFFPILFEIIVVVLFAHLVTAKVAQDITGRVNP